MTTNKKGITDQQVIDVYKLYQSPMLVRQKLGISHSCLNRRRKVIEERYGITLPVIDRRAAYNTVAVDHSTAVARYTITDGTILVGSDLHIWPQERPTMQRAFLHFALRLTPDAIVLNGDVMDGAKISRFASIGWEQKPELWQELEAAVDYLGDLESASPKAKRFWPAGNHDLRLDSKLANVAPEYAKLKGVHLKDHFERWTPCWRLDVNDDLVLRHRELGGEHADYRNVVMAGKSIGTGHDHRLGVVLYHNYTGLKFGFRSGYMCESPDDPQFVHYLEGKVPNWWPGFVVLTFKDGRLLMPEICIKHPHGEGQVQWRGEVVSV